MKRVGRLYVVEGRSVELFPVKVMAEALERGRICLVMWERNELFPKPMYNIAGHRHVRWYSAEQIVNASVLYRAMGGTRNGGRKSCGFRIHDYLAKLSVIFYRVDVSLDPQTGLIIE